MKIILILLMLSVFNPSYANELFIAEPQSNCEILEPLNSHDIIAQRGCCSHHGGVCGCAGTNLRCCDGVTSPSCGCHQTDSKGEFFAPPPNSLPKS